MNTQTTSRSLTAYRTATRRLDQLIDLTPPEHDSSRPAVQARAVVRMSRLSRFLEAIGHPELGYPIVHVGGTSGKGSTSTAIASILRAAGYVTGLHTSPYLQSPTEKLQLNGSLVDPDIYAGLVDEIFAAHDAWIAAGHDRLTYGEIWIALTTRFFQANGVDIAVLEVGAGGRFDLTNLVSPVVSVITSVGIDHTNTLGSTIADIAWHKAGIIKPGIRAVTAATNVEALDIIRATAAEQGSTLTVVDPDTWTQDVRTDQTGTRWVDGRTGAQRHTAQRGSFQAINGATAIAVADALRSQGFAIPDDAVTTGLEVARIPGRAEIIEGMVPVMLDGAHNPDKVAALAHDVPLLLPVPESALRVAVLGVLEAKKATGMVRSLVPHMDVLVATSPQVTAKEARDATDIVSIAREVGFEGPVHAVPIPAEAAALALDLASAAPGSAVLVTGSLYLVGNIRERWYQEDAIVLEQTPWPTR